MNQKNPPTRTQLALDLMAALALGVSIASLIFFGASS